MRKFQKGFRRASVDALPASHLSADESQIARIVNLVAHSHWRDQMPQMGVSSDHIADNPEAAKLASYPWFDWLRFVLASIVVLGHAGVTFPAPITGHMAVEVFFALSGWLIGGILLKTDRNELPRFFFNRSTRIWIPYALAIALLYGTALLREGADFFWFKYLLFDLTFTHQLFTIFPAASAEMPLDGSGNQFWSISVEEQFYLVAPLLILFVRGGKSLWLWLAIAALMAIGSTGFATIALGVCAAVIEARSGFSRRQAIRWAAVLVAGGTALLIRTNDYVMLTPILAVAIIIALAKPGRRSAIATTAGGISYPLYLNHWIGVFTVNFVSKRWIPIDFNVFVVAQYALNITIALFLYLAVDRQVQVRRGGWYSDKLGWRLAATAYTAVCIGLIAGTALTIGTR